MSAGDESGPERGVVPLPRLGALRRARFLSQDALAEKAGVSQFTVRRIERGAPARYQTIRKLAEALDVEPAELASAPPPPVQRVAEPRPRYQTGRRRRTGEGETPKRDEAA
jgi:transcriptional regulator with XRE-family HTH domain